MLACSSSGEQVGLGGPAEDAARWDSKFDNADSQKSGAPVDASVDENATPCPELDECACLQRSDCQVVSESCWCPFPKCADGACICGGGRFWGCAPVENHCPRTVDCKGDAGPTGADDRACFSCLDDAGASGGDGGQDPYGRCHAPAGAVVNSPECPVPNSTCNAWWCSPRCPANVGTGDDCPLPLTGTAERVCNFSLCDLSCLGGLVCPDGMECTGMICRWPAP